MSGLKGGDDSFGFSKKLETQQRFFVSRRLITSSPGCGQGGVLGSNSWIIKSRTNRVGFDYLSVLVLEEQGFGAMKNAGDAASD
jgi:hypothetical protein